jgi:hypothetical protein|nr:MAG TPA: hypothetical protein [Caudoviricetes sp.]DAX19201.1 MAG TPA: hypothetical protein [Caudoviricetes sp.]
MDKNHEITQEQEIAKELGWEVMANFRRLGDNLEENLVLKKIYEKIGKELKVLSNMDIEKIKEFKIKCKFVNEILDSI